MGHAKLGKNINKFANRKGQQHPYNNNYTIMSLSTVLAVHDNTMRL